MNTVKDKKYLYSFLLIFSVVAMIAVSVSYISKENEKETISEERVHELTGIQLEELKEVSYSITASGLQDFNEAIKYYEPAYTKASKGQQAEYAYYMYQALLSYKSYVNYILMRTDTLEEIKNFKGSIYSKEDLLKHQKNNPASYLSQIGLTLEDNYLKIDSTKESYQVEVDTNKFFSNFNKYFDNNMNAYMKEKLAVETHPTYNEDGSLNYENLAYRIDKLDGNLVKIEDITYIDKPLYLMGNLLETFFLAKENYEEKELYKENVIAEYEKIIVNYEGTHLAKFAQQIIDSLDNNKVTSKTSEIVTSMFEMYAYSIDVKSSGSFDYQADKRMFIKEKLRLKRNILAADKNELSEVKETSERNLSELDRIFPEFSTLKIELTEEQREKITNSK